MGPNKPSTPPSPFGKDATIPCDDEGHSTDDLGVVEPPVSKKVKIDNEVEESSSVDSSVNNDDNDEEDQQQPGHTLQQNLDSEELNFDDEEANSDDEDLFQQILAAAAAGRIPLEYLAARGIHLQFNEEDDESVEYPFDQPPTSIDDVADFIRSEKCQRIMVLAG